MKHWSLYPIISAPMPFQMAVDELLFRGMQGKDTQPLLRFYVSSEPWVTVGYCYRDGVSESRSIGGERKQGRFSGSPVPGHADTKICRRITGGGKVFHGRDLILSLTARREHDEAFSSVRVSYLKIHEGVKNGLERLGNKIRFYRCDENLPKGGDCFVYPIATDLALGNKKIAGGAQKRSAGVLLHQESIQLEKINPLDLVAPLSKGFEELFQVKLQPLDLEPELLKEAERLAEEKYKDVGASLVDAPLKRAGTRPAPTKNYP